MNRLVRPCTHEAFNDNEAFEAIGAVASIVEGGTSNGVQQFAVKLDVDGHSEELDFENRGKAYYTYQSVLLAIYKALNAPVLVTEEVLAGLPKDARILGRLVHFDEDEKPDHSDAKWQEIEYSFLSEEWLYSVRSLFPVASTHNMVRWYIIQANGCFKTAEYLRKFYTDGTPVSKGGSND